MNPVPCFAGSSSRKPMMSRRSVPARLMASTSFTTSGAMAPTMIKGFPRGVLTLLLRILGPLFRRDRMLASARRRLLVSGRTGRGILRPLSWRLQDCFAQPMSAFDASGQSSAQDLVQLTGGQTVPGSHPIHILSVQLFSRLHVSPDHETAVD